MTSLNRKFFRTLGLSWFSFSLVGAAIAFGFPPPQITVLVERSYCAPNQWQQVAQTYADLYRQHQNRAIQIKSVVLFSDLGQEVLAVPPDPQALRSINTYGRTNLQKQQQLSTTYPQSRLLTCPSP